MTPDANPPFVLEPGQYLSRAALERLLALWAEAPATPAESLYVKPGDARGGLSAAPAGRMWLPRLRELPDSVLESPTGLAALRQGADALVVLPPFPLAESRACPDLNLEPLLTLLRADYLTAVVVVRLGRFLVGVFQGEQLLLSKTDTRYVKGRHRAGGSSSRRFARIREGQIHSLYVKACDEVQERLEPLARDLDYVVLGGDSITLNGFLKECDFLARLTPITLGRRLHIRDPKHDTLEQIARLLWESRVWPLRFP